MNCLLVAATLLEIKPLLDYLKRDPAGSVFSQPDILVSGIGLTATAYHLTRQLQLKKYDIVIQAGIAGCFDKNLPLGTVVVIKKEAIADQGVVEQQQLKTLFDLHLVPPSRFPYTRSWLVNPNRDLLKKTKLQQVAAISVNQISTTRQMISLYRQSFNAVTESMEGAALHYTCLMENIPFLQFRGISNYIGERNKQKWNMQAAITNLNHTIIQLITDL